MPRYFFDIIDDGELSIDHVGSDCADDISAVYEARRCVIEMASERQKSEALLLKIAVSGSDFANIVSVSLEMQTAPKFTLTTVSDYQHVRRR